MNHTDSIAAVVVTDVNDLEGKAGAIIYDGHDHGVFYVCPCGCGAEGYLPFHVHELALQRPSWTWDGNRERPTLTPSVRRTAGCKWHGHLKEGVWVPVSDSGQ